MMRIAIDTDRCEGHARCLARAPQIFDVDDDQGKSVLLLEDVPDDLVDAARGAADACPERAISVRE